MAGVQVSNKFDSLPTDDENEVEKFDDHVSVEQDKKLPPIHVQNIVNYKLFLTTITDFAGGIDFHCKCTISPNYCYNMTKQLFFSKYSCSI